METEVQDQLQRILTSTQFKNSKRCSDFLRQVVEGAAEGRLDLLKERSLGVSVFDRAPDYDTNQDPIVRNTAGQVRKRLASTITSPDGKANSESTCRPVPMYRKFRRRRRSRRGPPTELSRLAWTWGGGSLRVVSLSG